MADILRFQRRRTYFDGINLRDSETKRVVGLYDPLVTHATPDDIYRKSADQHPDLIEALRKAGYRHTWRDGLDDLRCELRASPESHAVAFVAGAFVALTVVVIFVAGWLS